MTNTGSVEILDFGLAKLTQLSKGSGPRPTADDGRRRPGVVMGSLGYMSPEQIKDKPADARSDIFSFGAISTRCSRANARPSRRRRDDRHDPQGGACPTVRHEPERLARNRADRAPLPREESRAAVPLGARPRVRHRGAPEPPARRPSWRPAAPACRAHVSRGGQPPRRRGPDLLRSARPDRNRRGERMERDLSPVHQHLRRGPRPRSRPTDSRSPFVQRFGKKPDIWIRRAGGRNPIDLTPDYDRESYWPAFSPDGTRSLRRPVRQGRALRHRRHGETRAGSSTSGAIRLGPPMGRNSLLHRSSSPAPPAGRGRARSWPSGS